MTGPATTNGEDESHGALSLGQRRKTACVDRLMKSGTDYTDLGTGLDYPSQTDHRSVFPKQLSICGHDEEAKLQFLCQFGLKGTVLPIDTWENSQPQS